MVDSYRMYDTVLVSIDGSEPANRAADHGLSIAAAFDADLHAIYVVDTRRYGRSSLGGSKTVLDELEELGETILEEFDERSDVPVTTEIRRGRPHGAIDDYASEIGADVIVLGNRGLGDPEGDEIGSVAERVVRYSGRPVLTA